MSKKHRHKKEKAEVSLKQNMHHHHSNKSPFGINPMQIMNMLGGNMDMGQLGNMMSSLKMDGLDLNNINLGGNNTVPNNNGNPIGDFGLGSLENMMKNLGLGNQVNQNIDTEKERMKNNNLNIEDESFLKYEDSDENIRLLESIKNIVDPSKIDFIDKIIEAYENGSIK